MERALDFLLSNSETFTNPFPVAGAIRHLVIASRTTFEEKKDVVLNERLTDLFRETRNLQVLDWCGTDLNFGLSRETLRVLGGHHSLKTLRVECGISAHPFDDDPNAFECTWKINDFVSMLGPNLTYLELRGVGLPMYESLVAYKNIFSSYHFLECLSLDLTEGVWDWDGMGSPQAGASSAFVFTNLGFPAVREVAMRVGDLTISAERAGPMDLVKWEPITSLALFVDPCVFWCSVRSLQIFAALPPDRFSSLSRLEIQDTTRNVAPWKWPDNNFDPNGWDESGRCYWGLVPRFLASVRSGSLPNLVNLWVNQQVLCMPRGTPADYHLFSDDVRFYDIGELWILGADEEENVRKAEWVSILRLVLGRLESLRVGFGPMSADEVGLALDCCSPDRLAQFGFQYRWQISERESIISSALFEQLGRLPKLTDVHLLQPRPRSEDVYRSPLHARNGRTLDDISAIFKSNPSLCRVGVGQNTVWERRSFSPTTSHAPVASDAIILVQDGYRDPRLIVDGAVPRFFDIGVLKTYYGNTEFEQRPLPSAEIRELRSLLGRTLPSH